jgi:hypothetical protein
MSSAVHQHHLGTFAGKQNCSRHTVANAFAAWRSTRDHRDLAIEPSGHVRSSDEMRVGLDNRFNFSEPTIQTGIPQMAPELDLDEGSQNVRSTLDSVAKLQKRLSAFFPRKEQSSDNRRSMCPLARCRSCR